MSTELKHAVTLGDITVWSSPSSSRPDVTHNIAVNTKTGDYECSCEGYQINLKPRVKNAGRNPNLYYDHDDDLCVHAKAARNILQLMGIAPKRSKPEASLKEEKKAPIRGPINLTTSMVDNTRFTNRSI